MDERKSVTGNRFQPDSIFLKTDRIAVFVDGVNSHSAARALNISIDYKRLREAFSRWGKLLRIYYFTTMVENDEHSPVRPLTDWLSYNGFAVVTKSAREYTDSSGVRRFKGNMDVEMAVTALELAPHLDHAVLFTGASDFRFLVEALQRQGVRVSVVSTTQSQPSMISDELRRQADNFIELESLREVFGRTQRETSLGGSLERVS